MEQVDRRPGDFRYELGDGAYIVGSGGTVTVVASGNINFRCENFVVTAGGNVNITAGGSINLKAPVINLN